MLAYTLGEVTLPNSMESVMWFLQVKPFIWYGQLLEQ